MQLTLEKKWRTAILGWRAASDRVGDVPTCPLPHAYTPTSSSWMNLVERFFRDLTEYITEKSFASTRELADAIIALLAARNENPRRYVWKAKGEDILRRPCQVKQL